MLVLKKSRCGICGETLDSLGSLCSVPGVDGGFHRDCLRGQDCFGQASARWLKESTHGQVVFERAASSVITKETDHFRLHYAPFFFVVAVDTARDARQLREFFEQFSEHGPRARLELSGLEAQIDNGVLTVLAPHPVRPPLVLRVSREPKVEAGPAPADPTTF